jgi:hypothetical protein
VSRNRSAGIAKKAHDCSLLRQSTWLSPDGSADQSRGDAARLKDYAVRRLSEK